MKRKKKAKKMKTEVSLSKLDQEMENANENIQLQKEEVDHLADDHSQLTLSDANKGENVHNVNHEAENKEFKTTENAEEHEENERCLEDKVAIVNITFKVRNLEEGKKQSDELYNSVLTETEDLRNTDLTFFKCLGSHSDVQKFYDAIDNGAFFRMKCKLESLVPKGMHDKSSIIMDHLLTKMILFLVTVVIYYADIVKDILLALKFKSKVLGNTDITWQSWLTITYPLVLFCIIIASIVATGEDISRFSGSA